jgi:hypothetical protein
MKNLAPLWRGFFCGRALLQPTVSRPVNAAGFLLVPSRSGSQPLRSASRTGKPPPPVRRMPAVTQYVGGHCNEASRRWRWLRLIGGEMPVADHPLWQEWLVAEKTLDEARHQLRTVEHLDLGDRDFQEAWGAYRIALRAFNDVTNKLG